MTGTGIAASLTTLVTLGIAQPIRFGLQKRVQRLLHRATDHTVQVTFDPLVINRDDIAQRTRCILCHGGSLSLSWLRLATSSSARFGAASPTQLCERFTTSSPTGPLQRPPPRRSLSGASAKGPSRDQYRGDVAGRAVRAPYRTVLCRSTHVFGRFIRGIILSCAPLSGAIHRLLFSEYGRIVSMTANSRLPAMGAAREFV